MKIKAIKDYYDTYEKKDVSLGDVYETTEDRGELIVRSNYAVKVEDAKKRTRKKNAVSKAAD